MYQAQNTYRHIVDFVHTAHVYIPCIPYMLHILYCTRTANQFAQRLACTPTRCESFRIAYVVRPRHIQPNPWVSMRHFLQKSVGFLWLLVAFLLCSLDDPGCGRFACMHMHSEPSQPILYSGEIVLLLSLRRVALCPLRSGSETDSLCNLIC